MSVDIILPVILPKNYLFKGNNRNTKIKCEISSNLTIKTLGGRCC